MHSIREVTLSPTLPAATTVTVTITTTITKTVIVIVRYLEYYNRGLKELL
jgi:hypothetical protein